MKKSSKIVLSILGLTVVLVGIVGITYAYFRTGGMQEQANTFTSGCLSITLSSNSSAITINNAYPISDVEGLEEEDYSFTITNTCDTSTNYAINLESQGASTLEAEYIKVSLSSDTVGNVISLLSNNPETDEGSGIYELYTGTLEGNGYKTYTLKLWIDYDATAEQAANKTYQSKINVIANPEIVVEDTLEATFELSDMTLTANLTGGVTSATYCITSDNVCEPNIDATIDSDIYSVDLSSISSNQMVCTQLNETSKIICSDRISAKDYILTYAEKGSGTPNFANTSCSSTSCTEQTVGLYEEETSSGGTIYYYRGDVDDNYVKFAGYYWRIIRINEDGSIRLIYQGETYDGSGQIGTGYFNSSASGSYYVGYTYTVGSQRPDSSSTISDSTIKTTLENWYSGSNGISKYDSYITSEPGFCNDRTTYNEDGSTKTWTGTSDYYGAYVRLRTNKTASLECDKEDLYKTKVGLITADEVAYAGLGSTGSNTSFYLYTGNTFWTMSPAGANSNGDAYVFYVNSSGYLSNYTVFVGSGVRPVINLSADVTLTGSGTINSSVNDPFVVQTT